MDACWTLLALDLAAIVAGSGPRAEHCELKGLQCSGNLAVRSFFISDAAHSLQVGARVALNHRHHPAAAVSGQCSAVSLSRRAMGKSSRAVGSPKYYSLPACDQMTAAPSLALATMPGVPMQRQHAAQTLSQMRCKLMQALPKEMAVPLAKGDKAFVLRWIPEEPPITELAPLRCTPTLSSLLKWCSVHLHADSLQVAGAAARSAPSIAAVSPIWAPCHQGATH